MSGRRYLDNAIARDKPIPAVERVHQVAHEALTAVRHVWRQAVVQRRAVGLFLHQQAWRCGCKNPQLLERRVRKRVNDRPSLFAALQPNLGAVRPHRGESVRVEQPVERRESTTADERERPFQSLAYATQRGDERSIGNHLVRIVFEAQQRPIDVEQQRRAGEAERWRGLQAERSKSCLAMMMRWISLVPSPMHINGASR